jgi:hypothetical protein
MSFVQTSVLKNATVMLLHAERDEIKLNPEYQRMGGVWTIGKKRLLIDSILNDYDIPKLYFHLLGEEVFRDTGYRYAVIDGRQRLEAIWEFMDGKFRLASDFEYQRDSSVDMASFGYEDIAKRYPKIRIKFDSFVLPIVTVETTGDDLDLIEDMFSRLNEAVPLNAAEKRNAIGGALIGAINSISAHPYFLDRVKFSSTRYKHREVAARFLLLEESLQSSRPLIDTKKEYLDGLAGRYRDGADDHVIKLRKKSEDVLDHMAKVFASKDELLLSQGIQSVYYLVFRTALDNGQTDLIDRAALISFRRRLADNREKAAKDYEGASFELLEFDRLNQQGTNDASSIKERYQTLCRVLGVSIDDRVIMSPQPTP